MNQWFAVSLFGCLVVCSFWLLQRSDDRNKMTIRLLQRPIHSNHFEFLPLIDSLKWVASLLGRFSHTPVACCLFLTFSSSVSDVFFHPWQLGIRDPTLTRWIKVWRIYVHWDKQCCVSSLPVAFLGLNGLKAPQTLFWGQGYLEYLVNKLRFLQGKRPSWCLWHSFVHLLDLSLTLSSLQVAILDKFQTISDLHILLFKVIFFSLPW